MATIDANYIRETEGKYKGSEDFVDFLKSNQKMSYHIQYILEELMKLILILHLQ